MCDECHPPAPPAPRTPAPAQLGVRGSPLSSVFPIPEAKFGQNVPCESCARLRATIDRVEKEKEEAIRDQNQSFQERLVEISRNRKRLEEERIRTLRQRIRKELEDEMALLRRSWEAESTVVVEEACHETQKRAELEREREIQAVKEAAESYYKAQMKDAVREAVAEERRCAELQKDALRTQHQEELKLFQERICDVQKQLKRVAREKNDFECQFQELQLNYKRFIDLTDSALHSDYLLRLIRLGKPPGYAHAAVQTDTDIASID